MGGIFFLHETHGGRGCRGMAAPELQKIVGNWLQVRLAAIGVHRDQRSLAVCEADAIEACARELERLRRGGFCERQGAMAVGIEDFDAGGRIARRRCSQGNEQWTTLPLLTLSLPLR